MKDLNLSSFKVGAQLVVVKLKNGKLEYSSMPVIHSWDEKYNCWRTKSGSRIPADGKGYYAMHKIDKPHFYYSANPIHIKEAEELLKKRKEAKRIECQRAKARFEEFNKKLDALIEEYDAEIYSLKYLRGYL